MEISGYVAALRRWWWILLVAVWVAALAGFVVASGLTRVYEAEARLLVGPFNTDLTTQRASGQLALTYAELVTSQPLLESVTEELDLDRDVEDLRSAIIASPNDVTRFLTIRVQDPDPRQAAAIANALAQAMDELASGTAGILRPEGEIQIIDRAAEATTPIAPQVSLIVLMSAGAGLVAALVIVLMLELLSTRVRSAEDLGRATSLPVLASLPRPDLTEPDAAARPSPTGEAAGAYRILSTRLVRGVRATPTRVLLVQATSANDRADGFAADLAAVLAERSRRVALVSDTAGEPIRTAVGVGSHRDPGLGSDDALEACRRLIGSVEILVVHAPALDLSPAGLVWAPLADAVVVVAARDVTERRMAAAAAESLRSMGTPMVGAVLLGPAPRGLLRGLFRRPEQQLAADAAGPED